MRYAAFNTGSDFHLLDHIAPLAYLLKIPLIVTEEKSFEIARQFYPNEDLRLLCDFDRNLGWIAEQFDVLFECKHWSPILKNVFPDFYRKEMEFVFCPHGQSDKGYGAPVLKSYEDEKRILVYGSLMIQMLKDAGVWNSVASHAVVGNYRLIFYQKFEKFYHELVTRRLSIDQKKRTLLYAPTWRDADDSGSFFSYGKLLVDQLPSDWTLLVKPHPLLEERDPALYYSVIGCLEKKANVVLLENFPLVYPILALADAYLGDASSIGYDFLYFQKPLYFFPTENPGRLRTCGKCLDVSSNLFSQIDGRNDFLQNQRELYAYAFGQMQNESELSKRLNAMFC